MVTSCDLLTALQQLGVEQRDVLLVHSSLRAVGPVMGGVDAVLDALEAAVADGLLLLPTHSWKDGCNPEGIFDPEREPSCVGYLSERFRRRAGVVRSWHPTHSIAGKGRRAAAFLAGEELTRTPCPRTGCWGRLYDEDAKILFLGASLRTNTFLHSVEEWHGVPDRLASTSTLFRIRKPDASGLLDCPQFRHACSWGDVSQNYDRIEAALLAQGIARAGQVGQARSILCRVRPMADYVGALLRENADYFGRGPEPVKEDEASEAPPSIGQ